MGYVTDDSLSPKYQQDFSVSLSTIDRELHQQDFYEMLICYEGEAQQTLGGETMPIKGGDIFVICPDVLHSYFQKPVCYCSCILLAKTLAEQNENIRDVLCEMRGEGKESFVKLFADEFNLQLIKNYIDLINMERIVGRPSLVIRQKNYLLGILTLISSLPRNEIRSNPILEVKLLIDRDFTKDLKIRELAERSGYSVRHFTRIFIQQFGVSPKAYMIDRRLQYAAILLMDDHLNIRQIAEMCGYCDATHFSREFVQKYHMLPSLFRRFPVIE